MVFGLIFKTRRSAVRIVEKVCKDIKSPEATETVELIVWGVRHSPTQQLPPLDRAIITATSLWKNPTAVAHFLRAVPASDTAAVKFLRQIGRAALEVAREDGIAEKMKNAPSAQQRAMELDERYD